MTLFHDFEPEPAPDDAVPGAPAANLPVRVVVQYRERSRSLWLIPPVALTASLLTWVAVHPRDPFDSRPAPRAASALPKADPSPPVVIQVAALPATAKAVEPPEEVLEIPATEAPKVQAPPPAREAKTAAPPPEPAADVTQQALAAIHEEAQQALAAKTEMERLREAIPVMEAQARARARQAIEMERRAFHRGIQSLIRTHGNGAGSRIWELALRSPHDSDPAADLAIKAELDRHGPRLDRAGRVALFRRHGLPEPVILAELVREQRALMPSRKGPRTPDDAILRAAKLLLTLPPARTRQAPAATAAAARSRGSGS
jgi:hypothetical protein